MQGGTTVGTPSSRNPRHFVPGCNMNLNVVCRTEHTRHAVRILCGNGRELLLTLKLNIHRGLNQSETSGLLCCLWLKTLKGPSVIRRDLFSLAFIFL